MLLAFLVQAGLRAVAWQLIEVAAQAAVRLLQRKICCHGCSQCEKKSFIFYIYSFLSFIMVLLAIPQISALNQLILRPPSV